MTFKLGLKRQVIHQINDAPKNGRKEGEEVESRPFMKREHHEYKQTDVNYG